MSNLTVVSCSTAEGAQALSEILWDAADDGLLNIEDLAIVRRNAEGPPKMWQAVQPETGRRGLLNGGFWGLTLGTLFVAPLMGAATGVAAGLTGGQVHDFGIDDDFIRDVRDRLEPGTSALFILGEVTDLDALGERVSDVDFEIRTTTIDPDREAELREIFTDG